MFNIMANEQSSSSGINRATARKPIWVGNWNAAFYRSTWQFYLGALTVCANFQKSPWLLVSWRGIQRDLSMHLWCAGVIPGQGYTYTHSAEIPQGKTQVLAHIQDKSPKRPIHARDKHVWAQSLSKQGFITIPPYASQPFYDAVMHQDATINNTFRLQLKHWMISSTR